MQWFHNTNFKIVFFLYFYRISSSKDNIKAVLAFQGKNRKLSPQILTNLQFFDIEYSSIFYSRKNHLRCEGRKPKNASSNKNSRCDELSLDYEVRYTKVFCATIDLKNMFHNWHVNAISEIRKY